MLGHKDGMGDGLVFHMPTILLFLLILNVKRLNCNDHILKLFALCFRHYRDLTMGLSTSAIWKNTQV